MSVGLTFDMMLDGKVVVINELDLHDTGRPPACLVPLGTQKHAKGRSMTKLCLQDVVTRPDVHPDEQQTLFVFQGNRRRAHVP
jgi:hypothetical protein